MQEIPVGRVDLEYVETSRHGARGGVGKICDQGVDLLDAQGPRHGVTLEGHRARGDALPTALALRRDQVIVPGAHCRSFATGMSKLDTSLYGLGVDEVGDGAPGGDLLVIPETRTGH